MNDHERDILRRIVGGIVFGFGILTVGAGFYSASLDTRLYLMLEICGAILILAGMTPFVLRLQELREADPDDDLRDRVRERLDFFRPRKKSVEAEIIGITRNFRTAEGEREQFYVLCRYRDPVNQKTETFTSRALDRYPGSEIIGKKVLVIFHSANPEDYTVDLNTIE
uniref:hypothetical protein n=1 Tax=Eubacterium cellulosolvens TaxID=29322 RepID=UPI000483762B|nr:hypothetical protein [[Eubacterium] cellulosolvens]